MMKNYKCNVCDLKFKYEESMREHVATHDTSSFSCEICSKHFSHRGSYTDHLKTHANYESKYECPQCPCFFKNASHLNLHIKEVHQQYSKVIQCQKCKINFNTKAELRHHKIKKHPTAAVVHSCKYCNKTYNSKNSLKWHLNLNHNKDFKRSKCPYCPSDFKWPHHLKSHIRNAHIKNGQVPTDLLKNGLTSIRRKKNDCIVCDKQFDKKLDLMLHLKHVHKQVLDIYKCCICDACFSIASSLVIHLEKHKEGNSDHKCDQCHPEINPKIYEPVEKSESDDDSRTEIEKEIVDFELSLMEYEDIRKLIKFKIRHAKRPKKREALRRNSESDFQGFDIPYYITKSVSENGNASDNEFVSESNHSIEFYKCIKCNLNFETELSYLTHEKHHLLTEASKEPVTDCKLFDKEVRIQLERVDDNPRVNENASGRFDCDICDHSFRLKTTLLEHIRLNHGKNLVVKSSNIKGSRRKYQCKNCNEKFSTPLELGRHMKVESRNTIPQILFRCNICKAYFNNRARYSNHLKLNHTDKDKSNETINEVNIQNGINLNGMSPAKSSLIKFIDSQESTPLKSRINNLSPKIHNKKENNEFVSSPEKLVNSRTKVSPLQSNTKNSSPKRTGAKLVTPKKSGAQPVSPRRLIRAKPEKVYECGKCEIFFNSKLGLLRHISDVHMYIKPKTDCEM